MSPNNVHTGEIVLMLDRLSPLSMLTDSYSGLGDSDDDVTSQACQSGCVFFTDIGVDCSAAVAFVDSWHPDIVVKVLYAQRALVNVMHPVQDIHSWKASLVPDIWQLCCCVYEQCDKLLQGRFRLSYIYYYYFYTYFMYFIYFNGFNIMNLT